MTTTTTPAFNSSTRLEAVDYPSGRSIALVESGGCSRRFSAHYMVIDTRAARPILGEWPHTAKGLKAARAFYAAQVSA